MTLKNIFQLVAMAALLSVAGTALAGKQGISFYGGLGLSAVVPSEVDGFEYDPAAAGSVFLAIEEDGWALEYTGLATLKTGTNDPDTEYSLSGGVGSLGYRTLESRSGLYFLMSIGKGSFDVTYAETGFADVVTTADGNVVTLGMGMRLDKTERFELNYSYLKLTETDGMETGSLNTHMVTLRFIWGGNPYDPRF